MNVRILTACLTASALLAAAPASAEKRLVIDDDGYHMQEQERSGRPIAIDDDGWHYLERGDGTRSSRSDPATGPNGCTQLERSAGISGADCGTLPRQRVIDRLFDED